MNISKYILHVIKTNSISFHFSLQLSLNDRKIILEIPMTVIWGTRRAIISQNVYDRALLLQCTKCKFCYFLTIASSSVCSWRMPLWGWTIDLSRLVFVLGTHGLKDSRDDVGDWRTYRRHVPLRLSEYYCIVIVFVYHFTMSGPVMHLTTKGNASVFVKQLIIFKMENDDFAFVTFRARNCCMQNKLLVELHATYIIYFPTSYSLFLLRVYVSWVNVSFFFCKIK